MKKLIRSLALLVALLLLTSFALCSCDAASGVIDNIKDLLLGETPDNEEEENEIEEEEQDPNEDTPPETDQTPDDGEEPDDGDNDEDGWPELHIITIAEAIEIAAQYTSPTTERYYIRGIIETVTNAAYGAMKIKDETGSISVYGMQGMGGSPLYTDLDYKPIKGDEVTVYCTLQSYNGTPEIHSAWLESYVNNQGNIDTSFYTEMSVAEARDAAKGELVMVEGVVARITYANGMKPIGFILISEGESIYVYDADATSQVSIGNTVKVVGEKDYWILEDEQSGAAKFGYKGCNQITDARVVENDREVSDFDTTLIPESTVREILSTPVYEDVSTQVFKVNALVKKVPGNGFTNYYFFDLDGETGNYTYTQCNGSDFTWLDEFDGKICTVYLTALNAKSSSTSCFWRLLPVKVVDEGYTFDINTTAEFVLDYFILGQFKDIYTGNPLTEVITSVSSELLGFEGVEITYSSSSEVSVFFTEEDGKLILNCGETGKATLTVTATFGETSATEEIEIEVLDATLVEALTVKDAIAAEVGEIITVRGIVGPSLVNRNGFYLMNDDALIAVIVNDTAILGEIEFGQEIILTGERDRFHEDGKPGYGETCITKAVVDVNLYGYHEYSDSYFVTDKTLADLYALDANVDYSTTVFVVKATIDVQSTAYFTNIKLKDGTISFSLYCSSANQYGFLLDYSGEEVILEIAPCNWNNKGYWTGCVLAVRTEDGKIYNLLNFDSN